MPTPKKQSHWPTASPRGAPWPPRAQCQPTAPTNQLSGWLCPSGSHCIEEENALNPDSGGTPTAPQSCSIPQGRPLLHAPWPCPLPHLGPHLVLRGPQPDSMLCPPSCTHTRRLQPPIPHGEHQEDRPGLMCPVCDAGSVAGQVARAMALAGSLMSLRSWQNLCAPSRNRYELRSLPPLPGCGAVTHPGHPSGAPRHKSADQAAARIGK